jgi:NAD(P)-dependent dehydrogenase (short-subunit alcohol dehydrogenase family)
MVGGANRGIGREVVTGFLARGARHVSAGARAVPSLVERESLDPGRVVARSLDITDRQSVAQAAGTSQDVTLLVNTPARLRSEVSSTQRRQWSCGISKRTTTALAE